MKEVPLTQGKITLVDDEDYPRIIMHKWCAVKDRNTWYAVRGMRGRGRNKNKLIQLHRFLLNAKLGEECDHINGDGLDNHKSNLRIVTTQQNQWNQRKRLNTSSKYKGVHKRSDCNKWQARIRINNGKQISLGFFDKEEDAAKAYDVKAIELFGEYAKTNFACSNVGSIPTSPPKT